ncbi:hypothetical protein H8S33_16150 [Ornithinibacillus sp. BX22]|uniref:Uncharacterized protein n=2 Tax=Ornithinibacillus TaxID=484508 RepID=A0A923RJV1_9BACI|nr:MULTISPECIES: hypothetical protein [Ornithinibacillus]MBC5638314.1 hypothetical protein [Ornithinibacillus hominis]MBS3680906.1 hypothetical protein [Ornithinibacillus massiliensis]
MHAIENKRRSIQRVGTENRISEVELYQYIYKSLGLGQKFNKSITIKHLIDYTTEKKLIYHPFYIAKTIVIAERPPFPPRRTPNLIFVDGVSGYRGVFSKVPPLTREEVEPDYLVSVRIPDEHSAVNYVRDVQQKQINRSYVLKKPKHEIREISLNYLPLWKVAVKSELVKEIFYINANTGESEKYMSRRWREGKDLL